MISFCVQFWNFEDITGEGVLFIYLWILSLRQKESSQSLVEKMIEKHNVMWFGFINNIQSLFPQCRYHPLPLISRISLE